MPTRKFDVAVIGAGPGGLNSTLYLRRFKRSVVLINHGVPRARWILKIRNLVAHTSGLTGKELLGRMREQVLKLNPEIIEGDAKVSRKGRSFSVHVNGESILVKKVILATGIEDIQPPFENFEFLRARGLLGYCPICDGYDHSKDRGIRVSRRLVRIEALEGGKILRMHFRNGLHSDVRIAYVELGAKVRDSAFRHMKDLRRTKGGYVLASYHQETSIPGLYAVGDCVNALAQVSVAVGHGAIAATRIHNELGFKKKVREKKTNYRVNSTSGTRAA
jgi:thioredoxin reductase (NADPH)